MSARSATGAAPAAPRALAGARVLLTGSTGLVGAAVARALVAAGAQVQALVRERASVTPMTAGVEHVTLPSYVPAVVLDAVARRPVDVAIHLGAYGVKPAEQDALALVEGNAGVTAALLLGLAASPPARVVFAGSSAQYRAAAAPALLDEDAAQEPASVYGACKCAAERIGDALARQHALPFVSLRLFGVYGPGEAAHRMVPYLARELAAGRTPALTAGAQVRDWVYVDDVADAILAAAVAPLHERAYNVCSGVGVSVRDVARRVGAALGRTESALGLGAKAYRPDEPMWIVGDPTRLHAATGWRPRTSLDEGVARTVAWALASTPREGA